METDKILMELYQESIDCMCWFPQPATVISRQTKISLYKTRKILKKLKEIGLVEFKRGYSPEQYSYEGELEYEGFFYCGWELTEKGKDNEEYRNMFKKYCEYMDSIVELEGKE